MLKNYFKIAWRNLLRSKVYSFINLIGLSTGMAIALLIGLWIMDELSFDTYHTNRATVAQVMDNQTMNGTRVTWNSVSVAVSDELHSKFSDDFKRVAMVSTGTNILSVGTKKISADGSWAQPDFPEMLTLIMAEGSRTALKDPSSILLSNSLATALFGNTSAIGQIVRVDNKINLKVGGVYDDLPRNTSLYETKFLLPWYNTANYWNTQNTDWHNHGPQLYVQLNDHADFAQTTAKIKDITLSHYKEAKDRQEALSLHPMEKWHLYSDFKDGKIVGGRIQFVWLFGIISVFVLLLACINFMNLSTARSEKRAKEVGIRKAIGSLRSQLIGQFLSESMLITLLAFIITLLIVQLSLPLFNALSDKDMSLPWRNPLFWAVSLGFTCCTGLIAGSYPAFYLSKFEPMKVLKGSFKTGRWAATPRKVLVVVQFTVSIALIIGTIVVAEQIQYAKDRPVGYTRDGLISVDMNTPDIQGHYNALREDLLRTDAVADMTESNSAVTEIFSDNNGFSWEGKPPSLDPEFGTVAVTHDFGKTLGWQITAGRDFSRDFPTDSGGYILNESALKITGLKDPVGKKIHSYDGDHTIIGIVKDMVMQSPYTPTVPSIFYLNYGWTRLITLRINPRVSTREALVKIAPVFQKYNPGSPFEYKFVDQEYAQKFSDEQRIGKLSTIFSALAILISCLGLFGLSSFVAEQRTREIGVRKVLGASVFNVWRLLSKEFVALVGISLLIAAPLAYYYMHNWLRSYDYRTPISPWIFLAAGAGALLFTLLTVSFQAIKAALMNPARSLRSE
jgi:putative ABC transport system permease protein